MAGSIHEGSMTNQYLSRLKLLAPFLQPAVTELILRCERDLKRQLLVVRTWSSHKEQLELYKQGRIQSAAGLWIIDDVTKVVTRAAPGRSAHNVVTELNQPASMAVDLIPLNPDGTADWNVSEGFWTALYEIAWKCGLDPLGDQAGAYLKGDKGHFEEPAWKLKLESWTDYKLP
jgi:hypothetical protein